jgi:hypothetical protein
MVTWSVRWPQQGRIFLEATESHGTAQHISIIVYIITCRGLVHSFMQWQSCATVECSKFSSDGVLKIDETQKLGSAQMKHVSGCLKRVSGFVSAPSGECFSPLFYVFHFLKWTPDVLKIEPQKGINRAPTLSRKGDPFLPRSIYTTRIIHSIIPHSFPILQLSSSKSQPLPKQTTFTL